MGALDELQKPVLLATSYTVAYYPQSNSSVERSMYFVKKLYLGNRSVDFSEIWHEGSLMVLLKSDGARFLKKNYLPWMSSKNRYFSMCKSKKKSKLGIRSVDFSEIWHEGSLMVPPKSDGARFSKKNYLPWMSSKKRYFSMCKAKKNRKKFFSEIFPNFFFQFF